MGSDYVHFPYSIFNSLGNNLIIRNFNERRIVMPVQDFTENTQLSTHFSSNEFKRKGYSTVRISKELIEKLETLYYLLGATSHEVTSGHRPDDSGSQHQYGKAVDIIFYKDGNIIHPKTVVLTAVYAVGFTGAANINTNYRATHLDVRDDGTKYYGDEVYGYKSIWNQRGPGGKTYQTFQEYYGVTDEYIESLQMLNTSRTESSSSGSSSGSSTTTTDAASVEEENTEPVISQEIVDSINTSINQMLDNAVDNMKDVGFTHRFIGAPFRFLNATDPIITHTTENAQTTFKEGRGYLHHIGAEAPLVHFIPGLPTYLKDFDANNKEALSQYINNKQQGNELSSSIINKINSIEGRYFEFVPQYAAFMKYVNMLCRASAIYLGIGDNKVPGTDIPYKKYNWVNWQNGGAHISDGIDEVFDPESTWGEQASSVGEAVTVLVDNVINKLSADIFGGYNSVKCYVDASSSFSEDFSNNTKESAVAGLFETAESAVKELNFWAGGAKATNKLQEIGDNLTQSIDSVSEDILKVLGLGGSNLDNIGNYAGHIITGSNIIFPEMWGDSSYTKSYNFSINLVSPYGDPESIFLNIIQPMMFILPFVMPRQTSGNSYTSPFLVRVVAKGWFSCDMGLVEGISIEKGGSDAWTANGMPLEVKLGIRVKDLYTSMSMASTSQPMLYFNNPTLIEFLATTCGVNTIQPNISLKIMTMLNLFANAATDIPTNLYSKTVQYLNNKVMEWTRLF